jgi:tetratricopeptide (TPR) repeat protein
VQRLLALFLLEEIQDYTTPALTPLPLLVQRLQQQLGAAGTVLASVLLSCLRGIQSPDDLVSLTARFASFLAPAGTTPTAATDASSIVYISTSSPLGLFLRRVRLGLGNMSLQGLAALVAAVQKQVQDGISLFEQQQEDSNAAQQGGPAPSTAASEGSSSSGTGAFKDPAVLDAYFNTLLAAVSSLGPCLPAATVQAAAAPLATLQDNSSKLQYLDLAISLAHKDMNAALAALHQYFDCNGSSSGKTPAGTSSSKPRGQHQSALHNLAALQVSLGYPQEALAALQELLRLGQQQGDEWSLLHGLASLCRVMGVSEGLQESGSQHSRGAGSSGSNGSSGGGEAGWGLLDLRRTEQQLQLQALLQRCLDSARDMHVPHIAAYAAIALCRFRLTHASSSSGGSAEAVTAVPGLSGDSSSAAHGAAAAAAATAAGTSLTVQRMLLDVATLEHQTALAAAVPHAPATAGAAVRMEASQAPVSGPVMWASELYNPTPVFGMGTSTAAPGVNVLAGAVSARTQAAGSGWRSSSAAVSQALATGNVLAAAALQLQGAPVLAGVRALMALTGPGGAGVHDPAIAAAIPAAAATAATGGGGGGAAADSTSAGSTGKGGSAAAGGATGKGLSAAALTGSSVSVDDLAAGWAQLVQIALELQGVAAAQHVLTLAESHFPRESPQALAVVREVVRVKAALNAGQFTDARLGCEELQGLAPAAPQLGLEVWLVAAEAHVQLLQASGCYAEAHAAAAALFATAAGAGMQPQAVTALLLMAKACIAAGDAAGGLPYALSALLHCQALQFDSLLPEAVLQVATAWQSLAPDGAQFVLQLLQQVLPMAHAEGGLKVRGELEEAIARLQLALEQAAAGRASQHGTAQPGAAAGAAGHGVASSMQRDAGCVQEVRQRLSVAAAMLQQAGEARSAARCWLLLAHVCNAAGLEAERDEAAVHWQLCKQPCAA